MIKFAEKSIDKKRIRGVLIGCAYGDAMGMPTENMTREEILEKYPGGIKKFYSSTITDATGRDFVAGEVTDDTINTIILLESLVKNHGHANAESYIMDLRNWMLEHPMQNDVIVGRSTRRAMEALDKGEDMLRTGVWGTTNGASMKISPIGIICDYKNMAALVDNVYEISYPTHNTQIALQGACVIAALVSYTVRGGNLEGLWDIALQAINAASEKVCRQGGPKLIKRLEAIKHLVETQTEEEVITLLADFYGTGLETIETIPAVLAVLYLGQGYPVQIGQIAASLGGDTDTIGAIACAIAGGIHPEFSEDIVSKLENINGIEFDSLTEKILPYCINK